jgi:hypothetical protein
MAVAFTALVVALTGTAAAATVLITKSSQVKSGVITGRHVKNGSLGARDLSSSARSSLKGAAGSAGVGGAAGPKGDTGATGPKGDTGATGPKGDPGTNGTDGRDGQAGPQGPSDVYVLSGSQFPAALGTSIPPYSTVALTRALPAGNYAITARVPVNNNTASVRTASCFLGTASSTDDANTSNLAPSGSGGDRDTIVLEGTLSFSAPNTAVVQCYASGSGTTFDSARGLATQVGAVH